MRIVVSGSAGTAVLDKLACAATEPDVADAVRRPPKLAGVYEPRSFRCRPRRTPRLEPGRRRLTYIFETGAGYPPFYPARSWWRRDRSASEVGRSS